ncbi:MAG: acyl-CoA reductase [Saprospiraceae bacterium]|nr:acyl-CoA reductase [Saprospiraceae bacterium]
MTVVQRSESLTTLGEYLKFLNNEELSAIKEKAQSENQWFTQKNIDLSLTAIRDQFLTKKALELLINRYKLDDLIPSKKVGLVLAGNIPLVGFHDLLCCYLTGHISLIKYSDKDKTLLQFLIKKLIEINPEASYYFAEVDRLTDYDAVIATGSNSSAIHFETYFRHVPHIIRRNRNSVAVLNGQESEKELLALGKDVFEYFGLGCRNVSKVFLPEGYDVTRLFTVFDAYKEIIHHNKYKNNYDYNLALLLLNKETFLHNDMLILKESEQVISRIASLHYQYYDSIKNLSSWIKTHSNEIQCVVTNTDLENIETIAFGQAQCPAIDTFSDGVDTMQFLLGL